ncbi:uncharacterized protein LOC121856987 isoform X2 [Homarus americanus]|uniref:uncharacterized protein LOC121856987 isoform X2 n=1 Tax=Homarus americanus TaxID=6706 RepID=UPI001C46D80E|nr:uncharacterized protein LOC121856987 isoform X2 [Homarus americanus]
MESVLYSVFVLCLYIQSLVCAGGYETYHLESMGLCKHDKEEASIFIKPWKAAILKVGYLIDSNGTPSSHKIHKCKINVNTADDFGLAAVIEHMKIQGTHDKLTHGWVCQKDYIKLSTSGTHIVSKLLSIFSGERIKSKTTQELCGTRKQNQHFSEVGSSANVLSTVANNLEVLFHQGQSNRYSVNNSFTVVITSFKHTKDDEVCQGKYMCTGNKNYCIDPEYVCDQHYNCAFPSGGGDEVQCTDKPVPYPIFSTTTTIITTLAGIVGAGLVVCCIFTIIMKVRSRNSSPSGTSVPQTGLSPITSVPALQRQHTLPPYEAVVMSDASQSWKNNAPTHSEVGEIPPSYHMLYPEGPPKDLQTETAHTGEQKDTQPCAPPYS